MEELKKDVETVKMMSNPQSFLGKVSDIHAHGKKRPLNEQEENEDHLSTS
jgi:hypothetical protein